VSVVPSVRHTGGAHIPYTGLLQTVRSRECEATTTAALARIRPIATMMIIVFSSFSRREIMKKKRANQIVSPFFHIF
jgi:hypothetical protein